MSEHVVESPSPEATEAFAARLAERLGPNSVVGLDGDLGAGKTCFVRGLARGLGVEARVNSPTYTLLHEYPGRLTLYHFDAWMEGREAAFLEDGGASWFEAGGVCVVEWAGRVEDYLPAHALRLRLEHLGPERRRILVHGGESWEPRLADLIPADGVLPAGSRTGQGG